MLGNLLSQVLIYGAKVGLDFKFEAKNPLFPYSHSNVESCTGCPNIHTPAKGSFSYIDYPGFDDTHGPAQDICNAFFRKEVLNNVKNIKLVLVISYHDLSEKGMNLVETFSDLFRFFGFSEGVELKKLERLANAITIVVSHVPALENSAVTEAVGKLLTNYTGKGSALSTIGKAVLGKIIREKRWATFSSPTQVGTSPKTESERLFIAKLVQSSAYMQKVDTDIQVKVSGKYDGRIKTTLLTLVDSLKRQFAGKITEEISKHLQKFYNGVAEEEAIRKFQIRYQSLIDSTKARTLSELLLDLQFSSGMFETGLLEAAIETDKSIKFLRDLLDAEGQRTLSHRRDWLEQFKLRDSLLVWSNYFKTMTAAADLKVENGKMTLCGYFPKTSQIIKALKQYSGIQEIEILAHHTVTIDENLDGEQLQGVNVAIVAPKWVIRENRTINLTGKNNRHRYERRAEDGNDNGMEGTNGDPGHPGANGGHFFGVGVKFSGIEQLKVISNGGKGSDGQDGGNGRDGANGADGNPLSDFIHSTDDVRNEAKLKSYGWDHYEGPGETGNNHWDTTLTNDGKLGQVGGRGGMGGAGGVGGRPGTIRFISLLDAKKTPNVTNNAGEEGEGGAAGMVGLGGRRGRDWTGIWHVGDVPPYGWSGHPGHRGHFVGQEGQGVRSAGGEVRTEGTARDDAEPVTSFEPLNHLYNYREFAIRESNPLIMEAIEIFRAVYDSNADLMQLATVESLLAECGKMEDFYARMNDKIKCLPLYLWMQERLQSYQVPQKAADSAKLQCLHTLSLSKISQIQAATHSRLIIDIKGFLDIALQNVEELERLDHNVLAGIYKREYQKEITTKIDESDQFLKQLSADIRTADKEIKDQIDKLIALFPEIRKANFEKSQEILKKREELKALMNKRRILGCITVAVQCIGCCFPPTGPIVASVASVGLTIASNTDTAPAIGAELLSTLTQGAAGELTNNRGEPLQASEIIVGALARVRSATLTNAVVQAAGNPGSSEEEQLKAMEEAIANLHKEQQKLEAFKKLLKEKFEKDLHSIVDKAAEAQKALQGKSKIALDYSRLAMKRYFDDIKIQVKATTQAVGSDETFLNIVRQLEEAIDTTAVIYGRIQEYEERARLVQYMGDLAAPAVRDPGVEVYKQKVKRNLVLEQYSRAVAAVNQWAFPFASVFLNDFFNLNQFIQIANMDDFMEQVKRQLRLLQKKVSGHDTEINSAIHEFSWSGPFSSENPKGSFFVWNFKNNRREMIDLFKGNAVSLFADLNCTSGEITAVKFRQIELQFKSEDLFLQAELDQLLRGTVVELHHSGLSHYRYEGDVYQFANDKGFSLKYRIGKPGEAPNDANDIFKMMKMGNYMLSPYTIGLSNWEKTCLINLLIG